MSRHSGVICNCCDRGHFSGVRYQCKVCYDYDLCGKCFKNGCANESHRASHPMIALREPSSASTELVPSRGRQTQMLDNNGVLIDKNYGPLYYKQPGIKNNVVNVRNLHIHVHPNNC